MEAYTTQVQFSPWFLLSDYYESLHAVFKSVLLLSHSVDWHDVFLLYYCAWCCFECTVTRVLEPPSASTCLGAKVWCHAVRKTFLCKTNLLSKVIIQVYLPNFWQSCSRESSWVILILFLTSSRWQEVMYISSFSSGLQICTQCLLCNLTTALSSRM